MVIEEWGFLSWFKSCVYYPIVFRDKQEKI